jgi:hypothetical protein
MLLLCWWPALLPAIPLQEVYDSAPADSGYDRVLSLDPQGVYTGSLVITDQKVSLHGQGALINGTIKILGTATVLDADHCVFAQADTALEYNNGAHGTVVNCTFYRNVIGVKMFSANSQDTNRIYNCVFLANSRFAVVTSLFNPMVSHNCHWGNGGDYYMYCGCPISPYSQFTPSPGAGMIYADPLLNDPAQNDFHLTAGSPCINAGTPAGTDLGAIGFVLGIQAQAQPDKGRSFIIRLYPSPVGNWIKIPDLGTTAVRFFDLQGRSIDHFTVQQQAIRFDMRFNNSGYIFGVAEGKKFFKMVLVK